MNLYVRKLLLTACLLLLGRVINAQEAIEQPTPEQSKSRIEAANVFAHVDQSNNYTDELSIADLNILPMGLSRTISNINYSIAISSVEYFEKYAELTVFGRIILPQGKMEEQEQGQGSNTTLFFAAQGVRFDYEGNIVGEATLNLLGNVHIPIQGGSALLTLKGNYNPQIGTGQQQTSFTMDCRGFRQLSVDALISFPETFVKPVDTQGNIQPGKVTCGFRTEISNWNDILIGVQLPPFTITGLNDFIFQAQDAIFDYSDLHNDPTIQYPEGYQSEYMIPGFENLWRGIYIRNLSISLPKQFAKSDESGQRISFQAQHMILDNNGISGLFTATNILPIELGNASGWAFSVDQFSIDLMANHLRGAGFSGNIALPIAAKHPLSYKAYISQDNEYFLQVNSTNNINFDLWAAKATLQPNSYVAMTVKDGKFYPEAMLHGSLTLAVRPGGVQDTTKTSVAQLNDITFRSMHLQTHAPYFTVAGMGYTGEAKLKGFPLSISNIEFSATGGEARLEFNTNVALGVDPFAIKAGTRLGFVAAMNQDNGRQRWQYKECTMSSINVDATLAEVFSIKGGITLMNNDPVYGDGFAGNLTLRIEKVLSGMEASARAIFGYKDFRYWMIDGRVSFGGIGLPVFPPVNLNGFGGGAYYRMLPDGTGGYIPDSETGLGLKSAILFNLGSDKAINGEALFEIAFNKHGGLNFIGIFGQAKVLAEIPGVNDVEKFVGDKFQKIIQKEKQFIKDNKALADVLEKTKLSEPNKASPMSFEGSEKLGESGFSAAMGIQYNFQKQSLDATFDLYVNVAGGMLRGVSSGNRAGSAALHISPDEWYFHMGTPTQKLGIRFDLAGLVRIETGSYFMMGHRIPAAPAPEPIVAQILGVDLEKLNYMRDMDALGDGRGFAFGSDFKVETGDLTFLILYANFKTGLGFDIMLKDYKDKPCKGRGDIGMNGWYANGQAYAYLQGELGVKVNLLFVKKKIPVIKGGAATLMQTKLPNPSWFAGYLGVNIDLLGGLIHGRMRMKIELGEACDQETPGASPLGVEVISDLTPRNGSDKVDVFASPQVAFNMRIGHPFDIEEDNGIKTYRLRMEEFSVKQDGQAIIGKERWNINKDNVSYYSHEILPPNSKLKALVRVSFEELQNNNWITVYTGGVKAEESKEVFFMTGEAPDVIPPHNIEYTYPVFNQLYYYPEESKKAYIQLKKGQSYLFATDMTHRIRITPESGTAQTADFTYSSANNRIEYNIPIIHTNNKYTAEVVSFTHNAGITAGNMDNRVAAIPTGEDNNVTVRSAQAGTEVRADAGKVLLEYPFASSRYRTFADKINGISKGDAIYGGMSSYEINLQYRVADAEPLDVVELIGTVHTEDKPLVQASAVLDDDYFTKKINPLLYKNYPQVPGIEISHRTPLDELGVPPAKAIQVSTKYLTEIEYGNYNQTAKQYFPYIYNLPVAYLADFIDLEKQAVNRYIDHQNPALLPLIKEMFPFILHGYYKIKLQYVLPGEVPGSSALFEFYNPIK